ncbi:coiled-coil domain-containing protein 97 [Stigmatopora argus]
MWGEIEPRGKILPKASDESAKDNQPAIHHNPVILPCIPYIEYPKPPQNTQVFQDDPTDVTPDVHTLLDAVVASGIPVKSQQVGDAELTSEECRKELLHQYRSKPLVFLERYHGCLKPMHLQAFVHVSTDPRAQHYSEVIQKQVSVSTHKKQVRNQRYAALRDLQKGGQYFSDEQMRMREPLLYEQYIGQYLTDDEVIERSQEAMLDGAQKSTDASQGATGGLANLLLNSYQEHLIQIRLEEEQIKEAGAEEEEEDDDYVENEDMNGKEDKVQEKTWEPTSEEKALLREEFISQMHQLFLDGKDRDFNYSEVDENPDYDNLDIVNRDAEEKYFDEDDEEEDEPMSE